ncbi:hypothetical protein CEP52_012979 [Fusarium oligoseptatum]|uniref:Uncharacterized protein n=1 Tax=Fusarium oligoseptatum TaxID=2604345 RepID=A0A428SVP1_9HYPO|nr:hypothetical protein CEP52_012979 [Fusarium oligoseptatum]
MAFASPWAVAQPPFGFPQFSQFPQFMPDVSQAAAVLAAAPGPYQELTRRLDIYKQKLATQDGTLRSTVKENLTMAIHRLEIALLQLYKLAVFIRGDYDAREDDNVQKMAIFEQCSRAFGDCQAASLTGLEQLGNIHMQVTSFQTDEIKQLPRDIQGALDQTRLEMDAIRHQSERFQRDVEEWTRRQDEASEALQRAQDEREDDGREIVNAFLVQPLGGFLIGDVEQYLKAHNSLIEVMNRQNELISRRMALEQLAQQLPALQVTTDGFNKNVAALLDGFLDLKERATGLLLAINMMKNTATGMMREGYKKDRFAEGILMLCRTALIDGRVCDEVETITLEIAGGYAGQSIPETVSELLTMVGNAARETAQKSITG